MKTPDLTVFGECSNCDIWLELENNKGGVPKHKAKEGKGKCPGTGYSTSGERYLIKTEEEAREVATFIMNDDGKCLVRSDGHSMQCGDGDHCHSERLRLAKALAVYYMEHSKRN